MGMRHPPSPRLAYSLDCIAAFEGVTVGIRAEGEASRPPNSVQSTLQEKLDINFILITRMRVG